MALLLLVEVLQPRSKSECRLSKRFSPVNTRHLILTVAFGIGMLGPLPARAQESAAATASLTAKLRSATLPQSSALPRRSVLDRRRSQLLVVDTNTVSERTRANDEGEPGDCGELVEALLRWTQQLVTRLDPLGMLETPFQPAPSVDAATPNPIPQEWKPIPRVRPVQLPGGYGLVARITF